MIKIITAKLKASAAALAVLFTTVTGAVPVYASATSGVHTGRVDVSIATEAEKTDKVLPGQLVGYKITVTNNDQPAYVRVNLEYKGLRASSSSVLYDPAPGWIARGDTWYYNKPLQKNESQEIGRAHV